MEQRLHSFHVHTIHKTMLLHQSEVLHTMCFDMALYAKYKEQNERNYLVFIPQALTEAHVALFAVKEIISATNPS